jgi:hypothetical protein
MAKIKFTLKSITKEIKKAEKQLLALRRKVIKNDLKKIDLNLRSLKKAQSVIGIVCRPPALFGQVFTAKSKSKSKSK